MTANPEPNGKTPVHVIGAGVSGLAAAVRLCRQGRQVTVWDAAPQAGGRARSFFDDTLDRVIDNGNHLMLGGNDAVREFVSTIGSETECVMAEAARFPFLDIETQARWVVDINRGPLPWWVFSPSRRPPGVSGFGLLADMRRLTGAGRDQVVTDVIDPGGVAFRVFWHPLAVAVLNTPPERASARLLAAVLSETLGRGGAAARPLLAHKGLSALFADPALDFIVRHGGEVRLGARLKALTPGVGFHVEQQGRMHAIDLERGQAVVLAVPVQAAAGLVPGLSGPRDTHAILNVHFRLPDGAGKGAPSFLGLVGGHAQWLFCRDGLASVTISAADALMDRDADDLAAMVWAEVQSPLGCAGHAMPPVRVIKERRATFAATPENERRRPQTRTGTENLFLAGDWTGTGLPATIEGAVRSGFAAADAVLSLRRPTPF